MPNVKLPPRLSDQPCECGCGEFTQIARVSDRSKGWVRGEPLRFVRYHAPRVAVPTKRTWTVDESSGCWVWDGAANRQGYARILLRDGKTVASHRWVYEQRVGPVPEGRELHHRCENPRCVNPEHLEPLTRLEHKRRHSELRFARGETRSVAQGYGGQARRVDGQVVRVKKRGVPAREKQKGAWEPRIEPAAETPAVRFSPFASASPSLQRFRDQS